MWMEQAGLEPATSWVRCGRSHDADSPGPRASRGTPSLHCAWAGPAGALDWSPAAAISTFDVQVDRDPVQAGGLSLVRTLEVTCIRRTIRSVSDVADSDARVAEPDRGARGSDSDTAEAQRRYHDDAMLTVAEAARIARRSVRTIRRAYLAGRLVAHRDGNGRGVSIRYGDLVAWLTAEVIAPARRARPRNRSRGSTCRDAGRGTRGDREFGAAQRGAAAAGEACSPFQPLTARLEARRRPRRGEGPARARVLRVVPTRSHVPARPAGRGIGRRQASGSPRRCRRRRSSRARGGRASCARAGAPPALRRPVAGRAASQPASKGSAFTFCRAALHSASRSIGCALR